MRRHERRWRRLIRGDPPRPDERLRREGFDHVRVLDRVAADAVAAVRFGVRR
jgi:hypothetical protein